jgi:hypothetical protein
MKDKFEVMKGECVLAKYYCIMMNVECWNELNLSRSSVSKLSKTT